MKKIVLLLFCLPAAALLYAQSGPVNPRVADNAALLSTEEREELLKMADSISAEYNFDLVIVTEKSTGGKNPMDYADDYFDYNGYGFGEKKDGCLLLQVTESREYWVSTSGRGIKLLDDNAVAFGKLEADVIKHLKTGNSYEAYRAFLLNMKEYLALEAQGRRYNFFHRYNLLLTSLSWLLALLIGFIVVATWKRRMNTVLVQTQAAAYMVPGSLSLREKKDRFLYSTVSKTKRQSSSSGGGIHTGSSGSSHGGRGGRY